MSGALPPGGGVSTSIYDRLAPKQDPTTVMNNAALGGQALQSMAQANYLGTENVQRGIATLSGPMMSVIARHSLDPQTGKMNYNTFIQGIFTNPFTAAQAPGVAVQLANQGLIKANTLRTTIAAGHDMRGILTQAIGGLATNPNASWSDIVNTVTGLGNTGAVTPAVVASTLSLIHVAMSNKATPQSVINAIGAGTTGGASIVAGAAGTPTPVDTGPNVDITRTGGYPGAQTTITGVLPKGLSPAEAAKPVAIVNATGSLSYSNIGAITNAAKAGLPALAKMPPAMSSALDYVKQGAQTAQAFAKIATSVGMFTQVASFLNTGPTAAARFALAKTAHALGLPNIEKELGAMPANMQDLTSAQLAQYKQAVSNIYTSAKDSIILAYQVMPTVGVGQTNAQTQLIVKHLLNTQMTPEAISTISKQLLNLGSRAPFVTTYYSSLFEMRMPPNLWAAAEASAQLYEIQGVPGIPLSYVNQLQKLANTLPMQYRIDAMKAAQAAHKASTSVTPAAPVNLGNAPLPAGAVPSSVAQTPPGANSLQQPPVAPLVNSPFRIPIGR